MLPPPARETTTVHRVAGAIVFAFAFPPIALGVLCVFSDLPASLEHGWDVLAALPAMMTMSLSAGWVFVGPACAVWAGLHRIDRHHRWIAALVGLADGLVFASVLVGLSDSDLQTLGLFLISAPTGLVTGLGVWWIAYGRQEDLARSIVKRPPLAL
jgi:hypothetical protein